MSKALHNLVKPETLAYFFHVLFKEHKCARTDAVHFRNHLEQAMVQTTTNDPAYFKDVATVWAHLIPPPATLPAGITMESATKTTAHLVVSESRYLEDLGNDIRCGRCSVQHLSVLKYALSQKWAKPLLSTSLAVRDACVTKDHVDCLTKLMVRYAVDCTFKSTGDWMINAKTRMLCPPWLTCVTAGGDAPYGIATELFGAALNEQLKPTIRTPILTQVRSALEGNEDIDSFLALCAVFGELVPQSRVAINTDVLSAPALNQPAPFYMSNCVLPGVFHKDAYGIVLNRHVLVFNGHSIAAALCRCLFVMKAIDVPQARDAAEYVFSHGAISDSNPYAKYV
jgi:hypothetical protein